MEDITLVISYFSYLLPAIVVGLVAYYFSKVIRQMKKEEDAI